MVPLGKKNWIPGWYLLLGIIGPICKGITAWVPPSISIPNRDARAFVGSTSKQTISSTALFVDRREFLGQVAAGMATATNTDADAWIPYPGLDPVPSPTLDNPNNRTRSRISGYSGRIQRNRGVRDNEKSLMLQEEGEGNSVSRRKSSGSLEEESSFGRPSSTSSSSKSSSQSFVGGSKTSSGGRGGSSGGGSSNCFSGDAKVQVYKEGAWRSTKMEDLVLGDRVRSGPNKMSTVYAFGTRDPSAWIPLERFVIESGESLEVTENHILFLPDGTSEVAMNVEPMDSLMAMGNNNRTARILRKELVEKQGAYHPYTLDGKLVVNGFQVSVHSIDTVVPYLSIYEFLLYDVHEFQQLLFGPLRLLHGWSPETFSTVANHDALDGSHHYVDLIESLQIFLLPGSEEDERVNFASWHLPMLSFRILAVTVLMGCHMSEQLFLFFSWSHWVALLVLLCLSVGLWSSVQIWNHKRWNHKTETDKKIL